MSSTPSSKDFARRRAMPSCSRARRGRVGTATATRRPMLRETAEFRRGRNGERIVASILMRSGWLVVPSYDYSGEDNNQAPRMAGDGAVLVIPDPDACKRGRR